MSLVGPAPAVRLAMLIPILEAFNKHRTQRYGIFIVLTSQG